MFKVFPRHTVTLSKEALIILLRRLIASAVVNKGESPGKFETDFARYIGSKYAFGVSSGRAALCVILEALNFEKGTEIILSDYNFPPIPAMLKQFGLKPVFVDIHPEYHNLDVSLIEEKITPRTGGILVTHLFGQPCQMDMILEIAGRKGIRVIEDCAHACGSEYKGKKVGCFGDISYFSFGPGKSLPCFGGGIIVTNSDSVANKLKELTDELPSPPFLKALKAIIEASLFYSVTNRKVFPYTLFPVIYLLSLFNPDFIDSLQEEKVGAHSLPVRSKYKITDLQAEVGLSQLRHLNENNDRRMNNAHFLDENLKSIKEIGVVKTISGAKNIQLYYRIMVEQRDWFRKELLKRGIDSERDDMRPCSSFPLFNNDKQDCPVARQVYGQSLEIPCNSFMTKDDMRYIVKQLRDVVVRRQAK